MLGYRFPAAHQNRGAVPATLERNRLLVADGSEIPLGRFVGSGSYGMVFLSLDEKVVIKFETNPDGEDETMDYLMDINHWASEFDVGPKFGSWGLVQIDARQLQKLKRLVVQSQPRWFSQENAGDIYYSIFEKWDTDLYHYLGEDEVRRFHNIPRPVIERFAERIRKLHRRAVVHLDLAPKNVLIRVRDDIVEDMVLADFGLSRPRISWYFDTSEKFRESIAAYYAEDWIAGLWADYINKVHGSFRDWIVNEPFNADWCLVGAYAVGHGWQPMIDRLQKMPPAFNFEVPWDESGWLTVVVGDGKTTARVEVHGLMSLAKLRQTLKDKFAMNRMQFVDIAEELISVKDEKVVYPSAVVREFRGEWFINLDARGVSKAE